MPTESSLTQDLKRVIEKAMHGAVYLKHADKFRHGVPDDSVTWNRVTSWWEVKFWNEKAFKSRPVQEITCRRLASQGLCFYIIYERRKGVDSVRIVHPRLLSQWRSHISRPGFDHAWVASKIKQLHEGRKES